MHWDYFQRESYRIDTSMSSWSWVGRGRHALSAGLEPCWGGLPWSI